jgi:hypothetical protein
VVLQEEQEETIWAQVSQGFADADAAKDQAYLIPREEQGNFMRYDLSTPTTTDRVWA